MKNLKELLHACYLCLVPLTGLAAGDTTETVGTVDTVDTFGNIVLTSKYMNTTLDDTWFYDETVNDGHVENTIKVHSGINKGQFGVNIALTNEHDNTYIESGTIYYDALYDIGRTRFEYGTHKSINGYFNIDEDINTSGMILLPTGVYNNMFIRGIARDYIGAKVTNDIKLTNYSNLTVFGGIGESRILDQEISQISLGGYHCPFVEVKPGPTYEYGVNLAVYDPINIDIFYTFNSIGFNVNESSRGKNLTYMQKMNIFLSGYKSLAFVHDDPYTMEIHRIGTKYQNSRTEVIAEHYKLSAEHTEHDYPGSKGFYILNRWFFGWDKDLFVSYSNAISDRAPNKANTEISIGGSYSITKDLTLAAQFSHINSKSWQEIPTDYSYDDRESSFNFIGIGITYVFRAF